MSHCFWLFLLALLSVVWIVAGIAFLYVHQTAMGLACGIDVLIFLALGLGELYYIRRSIQ